MDFEVSIDDSQVQKLPEAGRRAVARATELMAIEVWGNIGREAPTRSGLLAGSFSLRSVSALEWHVVTDVEYAAYVHEGTGVFGPTGQPITPVRGQVLVFEAQGETVFAREVQGQEPNPYATRALDQAESRAEEFAEIAVQEVAF